MPSGMASTTRVPTRFSTASAQWPTSSNTSGIRVWHSLRPGARVNHTSDESEGAPMSVIKPGLDPKTVEVVSRSGNPEPFRETTSTVLGRSEEHTSELQSQSNLVCRLLLEKKKNNLQ